MALTNIFDIAGSALGAQALRLNTTASNLANADSVTGEPDEVYRAREPIFAAILDRYGTGEPAGGVDVRGIVERDRPATMEFRPDHPLANEAGYVYRPNVDSIEEMANMISASRSFEANVEVMNTSKQMLLRTLSLGE